MQGEYVNKVVLGSETLLDLTADTVTPSTLMQGYTAHDASGALITGTASVTEGSVYQDSDGFLVVDEGESSAPQGTLSITQNGTYDVADYAGASVAVPVGMTETELKAYIERTSAFTDIEWPDGMTRIGSYAFAGCSYFNPSSLPSGITNIESYAFYGCNLLALTSLPSGVTSINVYAFRGCFNLALTSLPSGITTINNYAFYGCSKLALTSLPSGVTSIKEYAFYNCSRLALTSLPSGVTTSIGPYAFYGCISLALTSLPSGLTGIGSYAFQYCTSLALTSLPSSVTSISNYAFHGCTGITSISCNGVITSLAQFAFNGDSTHTMQLTSASFPNMTNGTSAFNTVFGTTTAASACQLLEFCDIGSTTGIASNAFANCYALETLVLRKTASVCTLANVSAFLNTPMRGYNSLTGTVYVPSALISAYQTATNWSTLYNDGTVTFVAIEGSEYERD